MKRTLYIYISALLAILFLPSCMKQEASVSNADDILVICPRVTAFKDQPVSTKGNKNSEEQRINSCTVYIFDANGLCIYKQGMDQDEVKLIDRSDIRDNFPGADISNCKIYSVANIPDGALPSISEGTASAEAALTGCIIDFSSGNILPSIPEAGLPMVGIRSGINLNPGGTTGALDIEMICLFAKVVINVGVNPVQRIPQVPSFSFTSYQVKNVARKVPFSEPSGENASPTAAANPATAADFSDSPVFTWGNISISGVKQVSSTNSTLKIIFYIPEYRYNSSVALSEVLPAEFLNGSSVKEEYLPYCQQYKPQFMGNGQHASYVDLKGNYTDHQGHSVDVSYKLYLGRDNWKDFQIRRNHEYTNTVTISGNTNGSNGTVGVSVDHRVDIQRSMPYKVEVERETLLDSHIEIRPVRIAFDPAVYSSASVTLDPETSGGSTTWAKMERRRIGDGTNGAKGSTYNARGKRLFFWEDLLTNTSYGLTQSISDVGTSSGTGYTSGSDGYNHDCVWIYVDENTVAGDGYRNALLTVSFKRKDGADDDVETYTLSQWNLLIVRYGTPGAPDTPVDHYIERYEEYLHSYDCEDVYSDPQHDFKSEGMPWYHEQSTGGIQLSHSQYTMCITTMESNVGADYQNRMDNAIATKIGPLSYYDFYSGDDVDTRNTARNLKYNGQTFTSEVIDDLNHSLSGSANTSTHRYVFTRNELTYANMRCRLTDLDTAPRHIFEYILHKNKVRKVSDTQYSVNLKWYIPSTDEMEAIVKSQYSSFLDFQNYFYWSSQPAFMRGHLFKDAFTILGIGSDADDAYFYYENSYRARATKVTSAGDAVGSGQTNITYDAETQYHISFNGSNFLDKWVDNWKGESNAHPAGYEPGCQLRTACHRVRAVYSSTAPDISFKMN